MKEFPDCGTLVPGKEDDIIDCGTLVPSNAGTMVELQSNLGTMVINSDSEESTMKSKFTTTKMENSKKSIYQSKTSF